MQRSWLARIAFLPAVIMHELAHAIMVILVGGRINKFVAYRPVWIRSKGHEDVYGYVDWSGSREHIHLQGVLVGLAPLILLAPAVGVLVLMLFGFGGEEDWYRVAAQREIWQLAIGVVACLSLPLAAFPSPGDHIDRGALLVVSGIVLGLLWLVSAGQIEHIAAILTQLAIILGPMSIGAGLLVLQARNVLRE